MDNMLPTDYQSFIHKSRYARWLDDEGRRENWLETVDRYSDNVISPKMPADEAYTSEDIRQAMISLEVMPSMRALMTAGKAFDRDNTAGYNCSYLPIDHPYCFDEAMFILLCGTGVGFSVERQSISKLPEVPSNLDKFFQPKPKQYGEMIVVKDSKEGWAKCLRKVIKDLYKGLTPQWDTSLVRPAGAKLKVFGGRASGPAPLIDLLDFVVKVFQAAAGRQLNSIECHDIMCKIGEVIVMGGVRRSAMISLSNLSDDRMRTAKSGSWWDNEPQRALANNSVAYTEKPTALAFMKEWLSLVESGSGERGIFNRQASKVQAAKNGRRDVDYEFGTNPCSEIILRPFQFCNLTEVVVRATDSLKDLERKVALATILGTIQSTYTSFPYLRKIWQTNTEEERLLGVSLTGIMDNPIATTSNSGLDKTLDHLKNIAINTNRVWAKQLGIPVAAAITCVKPSGTVSQLVNSSSGIHARHSAYYVRTVRGDTKDPLTQFMKDQGIPNEPCVRKPHDTVVFSFPTKAPEGAVTTADMSAIEQLKMWLAYQRSWCEHKPSVTINVKTDEWLEVGAFVYENFDEMSGVSFLPFNEHTYQQAPYQECDKETYENMLGKMPKALDWDLLSSYEYEDNTAGSQTLACSSGACEIVDLT